MKSIAATISLTGIIVVSGCSTAPTPLNYADMYGISERHATCVEQIAYDKRNRLEQAANISDRSTVIFSSTLAVWAVRSEDEACTEAAKIRK